MDPTTPPSESAWSSPLLPPALAVTAGVALDRAAQPPLLVALVAGAACLAAAAVFRAQRLSLAYLLIALAALGCGYHAWRCRLVRPDEIALAAGREPAPARLRGVLVEGPRRLPATIRSDERLHSQKPTASATALLRVTHRGEVAASGTVRLIVSGKEDQAADDLLAGLAPGDEVEASGRLVRIEGPGNPGEFDVARYWAGAEARATLRLRPDAASVRRLREGWRTSPLAWIDGIREEAHAAFHRELKDNATIEGLARALLLSEGAPMTNDDWAKFVRTGVVHVLAISGQHLVVLASFLWFVLFRVGVRQRRAAIFVALILLGYALLTGGRPAALRAAVVCCAFCIALAMRRPALGANLFALAWLVVVAVNPASAFEAGCQLSFVAVAVLSWCVPRIFPPAEANDGGHSAVEAQGRPRGLPYVPALSWCLPLFSPTLDSDPLAKLIYDSEPWWQRNLRWFASSVAKAYLLNAIVWLAITPLAAHHSGVLAPVALLLGPPLTLLASIGLLLGFALLLLAPIGLAFLAAKPLFWCFWLANWLVDIADSWQTQIYVGGIPPWWLVCFYAGLFALFTLPALLSRWRRLAPAAVAWLALLLILGATPRAPREFRCTFLDVGHGGCALIESPDGRVTLFDAGAMRGPDVAARVIAPTLHARGIRHIDDVVISHADLDHYNGLAGVVERFAVGRVLTADSFAEKKTAAVEYTLDLLRHHNVRHQEIVAGDRLSAGPVTMDVLHPPRGWMGENANENSVTLLVRHGPRSLLLTGDLEGKGLARLLRQPPREVDIVQAPHHGSGRVDIDALLRWCRPRVAVSCQGAPVSGRTGERYTKAGVEFWPTWDRGAVTIRGDESWRISGHRGGALVVD